MSPSSLDVTIAGEPQVWADIRTEIEATGELSAEELCTTTKARALRLAHLLVKAEIMEKVHQKIQERRIECADDINAEIIANYIDYLQSRPSRETVSALKVRVSKLLGLAAKQDVIAESRQDYLVERQKFSSDVEDLMTDIQALRQSNLPLDPDVDEWMNKIEVLRG